jgi:hypothetical protein
MDRLFSILIAKFLELSFLRRREEPRQGPNQFREEDDLSTGVYYIRSLSNVLRWAPEAAWAVLAKRTVPSDAYDHAPSEISR